MQNFEEFVDWFIAVMAALCLMDIGKFLAEWAICLL